MNSTRSLRTVTTSFAVGALVVAFLAGCTVAQAPKPHTPKPTPTPTPKQLSIADAGPAYLALVCPANKNSDAISNAAQTQSLDAIHQAAATTRDAYRTEALGFTDPMTIWPKQIQADIKTLSDSDFAYISVMDTLSKAPTLDAAEATVFPDQSAAGAASQRIRAVLGLPADTSAECPS